MEKTEKIRNNITFEPLIESGKIKNYVFPPDNWRPNKDGYEIIANNVLRTIVDNNLLHQSTRQLPK